MKAIIAIIALTMSLNAYAEDRLAYFINAKAFFAPGATSSPASWDSEWLLTQVLPDAVTFRSRDGAAGFMVVVKRADGKGVVKPLRSAFQKNAYLSTLVPCVRVKERSSTQNVEGFNVPVLVFEAVAGC